MTKFITAKANDGVNTNALKCGIEWLLHGGPSTAYIYTPCKKNAQNISGHTTQSAALFKNLLKSNSTNVGQTVVNLCFGSGRGACGNPPPYGFTGKILLIYPNPTTVDWLLTRAPLADVCLLPWTIAEAAVWTAAHNPTVI